MSHIAKAYDSIRLAASKLGGLNFLADRANVNVDTARRLMRSPTSAMKSLTALEKEALMVLEETSSS